MVNETHLIDTHVRVRETGAEKTANALGKVDRASKGVDKTIKALDGRLGKAESRLKSISSQAATTGVAFYGINVIVSTLISGIGALAGEVFAFESNLKNVQIAGGYTEAQLADINSEMIRGAIAGETYGSTLAQSAAALYEIEQAGFHGAQGAKILSESQMNAAAGQADLLESSRLLTAELNAYAGTGLTAQMASNSLFQTILDGVISFDQLSQHMGQVIPTAAALGVNVQNLGAAVAVLTQRGQEPAPALTALNQFLTAYLKPSQEAIDLSHRLGLEFTAEHLQAVGLATALEEVMAATQGNETHLTTLYGNVRALRAIFPLAADGGELFNKMLGNQIAANQGAGVRAEALAKRQETLIYQFKELWARGSAVVTGALLPMAQAMLGPLAGGLSAVLSLLGPVLVLAGQATPVFMGLGAAGTFFLAQLAVGKLTAWGKELFFVKAGMEAYAASQAAAAAAATELAFTESASVAATRAQMAAQAAARAQAVVSFSAEATAAEVAAVATTQKAAASAAATAATAAEAEAALVATAANGALAASLAAVRAAVVALWASWGPFLAVAGVATALFLGWKYLFNETSAAENNATESTEKLTSAVQGLTQANFENADSFRARQIDTIVNQTNQLVAAQKELGIVQNQNGGFEGAFLGAATNSAIDQTNTAWKGHVAQLLGVVRGYEDVKHLSPQIRDELARQAFAIGQIDAFLGDANDAWAQNARVVYGAAGHIRDWVQRFFGVETAARGAADGIDAIGDALDNMFSKPSAAEAALIAARDIAQDRLNQSLRVNNPTAAQLAEEDSLRAAIASADADIKLFESGRRAARSAQEAGLGESAYRGIFGITPAQAREASQGGTNKITVTGNTFILQPSDPEDFVKKVNQWIMHEIANGLAEVAGNRHGDPFN